MKFTKILKSVIVEKIESKKSILSETRMTLLQMIDTYATKKVKKDKSVKPPKMDVKTLLTLIGADPDTKPDDLDYTDPENITPEQMKSIKPGKYSVWIIKSYLDLNQKTNVPYGEPGYEEELKRLRHFFVEDSYRIKEDLQKFDRFKSNIEKQDDREISNLTPQRLHDLVKNFSLTKKRTTKSEKEEASKTYKHPHSKIVQVGPKWTIVEISEETEGGKSAAVFYGGNHLNPEKGETSWCTSSPGLRYFWNYIKEGPLYVILPNNWSGKVGEVSGLPAERYQFHFGKQLQMKDVYDHEIRDKVEFFNDNPELKDFFRDKLLVSGPVGKEEFVMTSQTSDHLKLFAELYGLTEIFSSLPETIKKIDIKLSGNKKIEMSLPNSVSRFKNLEVLSLHDCGITEIPESLCQCKNLTILSFVGNKNLKTLPECLADLPNLYVISFGKEDQIELGPKLDAHRTEDHPNLLSFM